MRATEADREAAAGVLTAGCAAGMLSVETLEWRLERVFGARSPAELGALIADLARPTWLERLQRRLGRTTAGSGATTVALPEDAPLVIGRSRACDLMLDEPSVSRRHLVLRPIEPGAWCAVDLGSTNGTWSLGRRVGRLVVVPGDELVLGQAVVRLI